MHSQFYKFQQHSGPQGDQPGLWTMQISKWTAMPKRYAWASLPVPAPASCYIAGIQLEKNKALLDTLVILKQCVSHQTWIYLHYYSYGWEEFSCWTMIFPNLVISLTLFAKDCHPDLVRLIQVIDPNHLLLELFREYCVGYQGVLSLAQVLWSQLGTSKVNYG